MIQLELQPELEAQLAAEAEATGLPIENLIQNIVAERLADQDLQRGLDDIAAGRTRPAREVFAELDRSMVYKVELTAEAATRDRSVELLLKHS